MSVSFDPTSGRLSGPEVTESQRTVGQLAGWFADESSRASMDPDTVVYRVESYMPVPEGQLGAVCIATTYLEAGAVGEEYFFTRGHFHANEDGPELCVCVSGRGALVLMSRDRDTWIEQMRAGSILPVPTSTAHRAVNFGNETLVFVSYWQSEIGHDYAIIERNGFGARLRKVSGEPVLIPEGRR